MKKVIRMMGFCALIALAAVACKKNEQKDTVTFKATLPQPASNAKTHIGSENWLMWNAGDSIKVYTADKTEANAAVFTTTADNVTEADFSGTLAESDTYYAFYPTTGVEQNADGKFMLPVRATQTFVDSNFTTNTFPMCAMSTDGTFNFHSPFGILGIPMTGDATIGSIVLTDTTGMQLAGYYAMNATDTIFVGTGAAITLDFGAGLTLDTNTPTTAYFIVRAGAFQGGFTAAIKGTDGSTILNLCTMQPNTILKESIHMMPATEVNAAPAPSVGPLPAGSYINGAFSVSPTLQVYFAKGNLQYIGTAGNGDENNTGAYWKLADNQWDFFGTASQLGVVGAQVDRDLFQWGTSGYNHGGTPYKPYHESTSTIFTGNWLAYGAYNNNLGDGDGTADWGYNALHFGPNADDVIPENSGWRTLTGGSNPNYYSGSVVSEWIYVLNSRTTANGQASVVNGIPDARFVKATVNGKAGLILFPDQYTQPAGVAIDSINEADVYFTANHIDASSFALMEANGAVFLPAAGYMNMTADPNTVYYQSSSWDYNPLASWTLERNKGFMEADDPWYAGIERRAGTVRADLNDYRSNYAAVRLVHNVE